MKRLLVFVFAIMPFLAFATDEICPAGYQPEEYIELEYIESTGTQYIILPIKPSDYTNFEVKAELNFSPDGVTQYFGANYGYWFGTTSGNLFTIGGGLNTSQERADSTFKSFKLISSRVSSSLIVVTLTVNEETTASRNSSTSNIPSGFSLFGIANFSGTFVGKGKTITIYGDGTMLGNYIPAKHNSDNAIGMYDTVSGKFFTNQGTGEFIAGPEKTEKSFIADENGDITCISCPANTYKPNAGNTECTKCPENTFSPVGSKELGDCAKILRVKDYVVYMPLGKRTEHGLCVMVDDKKYCADVYERQ